MKIKKDLTTVNFTKGRAGYHIEGIVLHSMVGTQAGSISWFKNPNSKASAHYCISKTGEIVQCVLDEDFAWHAGNVTTKQMPFIVKDNWEAGVTNPNFYTIGIELEDNKDYHWNYPKEQLKSLVELIKFLSEKYKIPLKRSHILMHREIDPQNRSDPIGRWDMDAFMALLGDVETHDCAEWEKKAKYEEAEKDKYKSEAREGRDTIKSQKAQITKLEKKVSELTKLYTDALANCQNPSTPPSYSKEDYEALLKTNKNLVAVSEALQKALEKEAKNAETSREIANELTLENMRLLRQEFTFSESLDFLIASLKGGAKK